VCIPEPVPQRLWLLAQGPSPAGGAGWWRSRSARTLAIGRQRLRRLTWSLRRLCAAATSSHSLLHAAVPRRDIMVSFWQRGAGPWRQEPLAANRRLGKGRLDSRHSAAGRAGRQLRRVSPPASAGAAPSNRLRRYETGSNPSFCAGSQRMSHEVIVNVSLSNWFITPNEVATVRCGPLMS
jgi:hypothetical protein